MPQDQTTTGEKMTALTTTKGQTGLPRYFGAVFEVAKTLENGRLDFTLPDGRLFSAQGAGAGPVARIDIHNLDLFARLIREGDLGFCEAYLDGWWTTPDLQAVMDLVHTDNDGVYDGFQGQKIVRAFERLRHWLRSNSRGQARKNIAHHYDLGNDFYGLWLDETMTYSSALFATGQEGGPITEILDARVSKFRAHHARNRAADDPRDNRENQVQRADILVVGRHEPALEERGLVIGAMRMIVVGVEAFSDGNAGHGGLTLSLKSVTRRVRAWQLLPP
jgi:hypothetical protein